MSNSQRSESRFEPCDIVLTRGTGLLSRTIRVLTRGFGEPRTKVNHVGIVVEGGTVREAVIVEALSTVQEHRLVDQYDDGKTEVAVYRPLNLTDEQRAAVVAASRKYVGRTYGYFKLGLHLLDWMLLGAYVFRRLGGSRYPICSWLVAEAFGKAGLNFGKAVGQAQPDDIWDFVTTESEKYERVRALSLIV